MQRDLAVCSVSASVGATRHVVHRRGTHWMGRPLARSPVARGVTAGPGRTDRALDTAPRWVMPSPPGPAGRAAPEPDTGVGSAEPWQVSGYRGWTAQPVPGRCAASPDHPTGAATWAAIILTAMSLGTVGIRPRRTPIPGPSGRRVGQRPTPTRRSAHRRTAARMGPAGDARPTGAGARCAAPVALRRGSPS
jgi:hypothetical protein